MRTQTFYRKNAPNSNFSPIKLISFIRTYIFINSKVNIFILKTNQQDGIFEFSFRILSAMFVARIIKKTIL